MNLIFTFITAEEGRPRQKLASLYTVCRKQTWVALVVSKLYLIFIIYEILVTKKTVFQHAINSCAFSCHSSDKRLYFADNTGYEHDSTKQPLETPP